MIKKILILSQFFLLFVLTPFCFAQMPPNVSISSNVPQEINLNTENEVVKYVFQFRNNEPAEVFDIKVRVDVNQLTKVGDIENVSLGGIYTTNIVEWSMPKSPGPMTHEFTFDLRINKTVESEKTVVSRTEVSYLGMTQPYVIEDSLKIIPKQVEEKPEVVEKIIKEQVVKIVNTPPSVVTLKPTVIAQTPEVKGVSTSTEPIKCEVAINSKEIMLGLSIILTAQLVFSTILKIVRYIAKKRR